MSRLSTIRRWAFCLAVLGITGATGAGEATLDERVVGPLAQDARYVVSPRGVRLAAVIAKGSRFAVVVDGTEGPKFDEIVAPTASHVDPRPSLRAQREFTSLTQQAANLGVEPPDPTGRAVTFSRDGTRYAYIGRLGEEWVVVADGKEVLRLPAEGAAARATIAGNMGSTALRLEFTGNAGKHLLFAKSAASGEQNTPSGAFTNFGAYDLWVDGEKMPGVYLSGVGTRGEDDVVDPVISADGEHVAYVAQIDRERQTVVLDGKDAGYLAENLQFSADGQHLIGIRREANKPQEVVVDGKPVASAPDVSAVHVAPAGERTIVVASSAGEGGVPLSSWLIVEGNKVEATVGEARPRVVFSPDGSRYAAVCGKPGAEFVVVDGTKGQEYFKVEEPVTFSADSKRVGYVAWVGPKRFVVVDGEESDAFDGSAALRFSPDGKRVAWCGSQQGGFALYVDGKLVRRDPQVRLEKFEFSPDGSRYAFAAADGIYLDGEPTGIGGERFLFSPDGKHFAVWGERRSADPAAAKVSAFGPRGERGLFVDGRHVFGGQDGVDLRYRAFTPDSRHLCWMSFEQPKDEPTKPVENVVYIDGQPVTRCDRVDVVTLKDVYTAGAHPFIEPGPAWQVGEDGTLTFLAPVGAEIKRVTITPAADTSVTTMIEAAEAAAGQAAADEAKRAQDDMEAKEKAAADRKAAREEAAAKKKADYERRMAERQAERERVAAERAAKKAEKSRGN